MLEYAWSPKEKTIARTAFDKAFNNECTHVIATLRTRLSKITEPRDVWKLETYLSEKRRLIDRKYDYRYSALILVFGALLREGWIETRDLDGLAEDKLQRIKAIAEGIR